MEVQTTFHLPPSHQPSTSPKGGHGVINGTPRKWAPEINGLSWGETSLKKTCWLTPTYRCPRCKVIYFSSCSSTWPTGFFSPQFHRTQVASFVPFNCESSGVFCGFIPSSIFRGSQFLLRCSLSPTGFSSVRISDMTTFFAMTSKKFRMRTSWICFPAFQSADSLCPSFPAGNASHQALIGIAHAVPQMNGGTVWCSKNKWIHSKIKTSLFHSILYIYHM